MISGFTLIVDRNFKPGDRINVGGISGDVENIGLRSTRIRIGDGNSLIVPNSELVNSRIINLSQPTRETTAAVELRLSVDADLSEARRLVQEVLAEFAAQGRFSAQRGHSAQLKGAHQGYWLLHLNFWAQDLGQVGDLQSDVLEAAVTRLRAARIPLDGGLR